MKCPICKSKLKSKVEIQSATLVTGDKFSFKETVFSCAECGFKGPLGSKSYGHYLKARDNAVIKAVKGLVGKLQTMFMSLLYVERSLDLPSRSLSRWKNSGEASASTLLLLKMIETFPFLVEVAERKFDRQYAVQALQNAATESSVGGLKVSIVEFPGKGTPIEAEMIRNSFTQSGMKINL